MAEFSENRHISNLINMSCKVIHTLCMLRFISKLNDDLKDQLFILCSATSRYLTTITAQLMLGNVVPNSFVTPEGRMSRLGGWPN